MPSGSDSIVVRPATAFDAAALGAIRAACDEGASELAEAVDFLDRLSIPHGEDYFCLLAELDGEIAGYLIGGGSRDLDRKAHGEIYELAVAPALRRRHVATRLVEAAIAAIEAAEFAGTLLHAEMGDEALQAIAAKSQMELDRPPDGSLRFERARRPSRPSP